jgi:hypothetical protein
MRQLLAMTPAQLEALGLQGRRAVEMRFDSQQNAGLLTALWKGTGES